MLEEAASFVLEEAPLLLDDAASLVLEEAASWNLPHEIRLSAFTSMARTARSIRSLTAYASGSVP